MSFGGSYAPWEQTLHQFTNQFASQAKYDDFAAMAAVTAASVAYATKGYLWARPDPYAYKLYERPQQSLSTGTTVQQSRDLAQRLDEENADVAILWASQSGTAERFAARLAKDLSRYLSVKVLLVDLSDIEPASCTKVPEGKLAFFLASTFGEGDPSDNMHEFWEWLHTAKGASLQNFRYLAFGLGNSKYKHYNAVMKTVASQLDAFGAKLLMPVGYADDAAGETEEHFLEWKEHVFTYFQEQLGYKLQEVGYEPSIDVQSDNSLEPIDLHHGIPNTRTNAKGSSAQSKVYALPITQSRELFQDTNGRNCIHMELDINEHPELKYKTGDHLAVWPVNPTVEIERLVSILGLEERRASPCHIKSLDGTPVKVPSPTTLNALLEHYLEVCAPVPRDAIATLATYAPTEDAKQLLLNISKSKESYHEYQANNYVNLGRLMEKACPGEGAWKGLPLSLVIETLPAMQPRYYSISSSSVVQARRAAITAVVSDTALQSQDRIPGLATNYLLSLKNSFEQPAVSHPNGLTYSLPLEHQPLQASHIHAAVRKSTFKMPPTAATPVVMVGAGTGVAPFRAFVAERSRLKAMGRDVGATKLFFGCRHPQQDFIYSKEFEQMGAKLGDGFSLTTAFSRPDNKSEKRYVQDCVEQEAEEVCKLLVDEKSYFYICGSAGMAREVSDVVNSIIRKRQGWSEEQMKDFADRQKKQKRWLQDVWG
ncbi:riboflavin synthase domain-like protein [Hortaea werneckii]|nr:riboflavin synthase domain-like protein [Hortaea werneckii]